ncbi:uncharacterized protein LOC126719678 [Quercus robur]|uniref:uncharacterized protein LOC126719678 n=1 Tax=Quercus robur TaxID=38942 RepID=UPI0021620773|nr:uncharacterized protein LOC126719678 [Quercus robur]
MAMDEQMQTMSIKERRTLAEPIEILEDVPLDESNPEKFTKIGTNMPGIDLSVITYRLNVSSSYEPVRQKKRVFTPERDNAIKEEVHKLVTTEFICEVYYLDWLANVVMVKKANGKWKMCMDFTDLNKACPKDSYPLPRIDQSVDSTAGN